MARTILDIIALHDQYRKSELISEYYCSITVDVQLFLRMAISKQLSVIYDVMSAKLENHLSYIKEAADLITAYNEFNSSYGKFRGTKSFINH